LHGLAKAQCGDDGVANPLLHHHAVAFPLGDCPAAIGFWQAVQHQRQRPGFQAHHRWSVFIGWCLNTQHRRRNGAGLLLDWFDKAAGLTVQADTVAKGMDPGIAGAQLLVHLNATVECQPGLAGQPVVGFQAGGGDHLVHGQGFTVCQQNGLAVTVGADCLNLAVGPVVNAQFRQAFLECLSGFRGNQATQGMALAIQQGDRVAGAGQVFGKFAAHHPCADNGDPPGADGQLLL